MVSDNKSSKMVTFNNDLDKRQEEYDNSFVIKKPETIDFTDNNIDKPIGEEMNRLISEAQQKRENELNLIIHDKKKNIEIGDKISIPMNVDNVSKQVTFDTQPSNITKVAYDTTKNKIYDADLASKGILKEILFK